MVQMPKPKKTKAINPFLNSRREWNEVVGDMAKREHFWRLTALMALSILFISIMGNIFQGTQAKLKPYIVEVDKLGKEVNTLRDEIRNKETDIFNNAKNMKLLNYKNSTSELGGVKGTSVRSNSFLPS